MDCARFFTIAAFTFFSGIVLGGDYEFMGPNGERLSIWKSFDDEFDCTLQIGKRTFSVNAAGKETKSGVLTEFQDGREEPVEVGTFLMKKPAQSSKTMEVKISMSKKSVERNPKGIYHLLSYEDQLKLAKNNHAIADAALNAVYTRLMILFSDEKKVPLRESQRSWIEYRDYMVERQPGMEEKAGGDKSKSVQYWELIAGLSESQAEFLEVLGHGNPDHRLDGVWIDGNGGHMSLKLVEGKSALQFSLNVVRGPTYHTGEISGVAPFVGNDQKKAVFVDEDKESFIDGKPCIIEFLFDGEKFEITSENARMYLGARAYFEGIYLRSGALK